MNLVLSSVAILKVATCFLIEPDSLRIFEYSFTVSSIRRCKMSALWPRKAAIWGCPAASSNAAPDRLKSPDFSRGRREGVADGRQNSLVAVDDGRQIGAW